ncbi:MAG TPA: 2,3-bisphosphoglycerate-dependent phosphoglycerate mutase [Aggregatilinea sp.]|uniref:2,3-bisphosphoglycerate-dependent phosphoglycerate mutase n=1 Tax=Aggregatilinea sp. TaxID=2806333 RepID=UPI002B869CE6|nr:2,3-bisphosphoglycerate-dependent phosphoglycerate mutase [Aggregatilinea sp.]HML24743.1 2,3-bisphosphoglycerate-dependent phosphoglycerate mutase [Aggregatilinea sp.]
MATGMLILVRHGQSQWNLENRFTGWTDVPLTDQGRAEARAAGEALRGLHIDRAFTSELSRAQETLRIILSVTGQEDVPVSHDAALNERSYGDLQGLNKAETAQHIGEAQVYAWRRTFRGRPPGGESLEDTQARVLPYYRAAIEPHLRIGETVLVVSHGNTLRALVMVLDEIPEAALPELSIPTGVPRCYRVDEAGVIRDRYSL